MPGRRAPQRRYDGRLHPLRALVAAHLTEQVGVVRADRPEAAPGGAAGRDRLAEERVGLREVALVPGQTGQPGERERAQILARDRRAVAQCQRALPGASRCVRALLVVVDLPDRDERHGQLRIVGAVLALQAVQQVAVVSQCLVRPLELHREPSLELHHLACAGAVRLLALQDRARLGGGLGGGLEIAHLLGNLGALQRLARGTCTGGRQQRGRG